MQFYSASEFVARPNDRVFKVPLLGRLVWLLLCSILASVFLYAGLHRGLVFIFLLPPEVCYGAAAFAAGAAWLAYCGVRAGCKPTNWVARGNDSSLAIKYRSWRNWRLPAEEVQIVELAYSEIAWARMVKEWCETTSLGGEKRRALEVYLDLGLVAPDTSLLETRLREEANRKCPDGIILHHDYPVQVLPGGIIRINWRSHGGGAYSTPKDALTWLKHYVKIVDAETSKVDLTSANSPEEVDATIRQLLQRGDDLAAIALVRTSYGSSITEAKAYVEQLKARLL